ncbi:putative phosphatidylglycerol/phosphatidylinositol transfer protein 2 [Ruditapes philippinarum]|uniref:putative phosphatidylglycerol/phosphatidylinositol transfer protein 2 n=1 Tax=Ruditapes philippinarum TaxID=129788 RepID=UPI00295AD4A5|nr:putative phosphatidylglycerol/phosphatidylinositol transfer protein 2 [Ruditapes philippinarum]
MLRVVYRKMCNLTCKKAVILAFGIFFVLFFVCYLAFFNHGPPENIMAANRGNRKGIRLFEDKDSHKNELDKEIEAEERKALEYWEDFIKKHDYTAIGEIYDNCDEKDRMMIGRTIMLPDRRWGGIKGVTARTFINTTLDSELSGGRFYLEVKYNGKDLYSNNWELCTLDEDYDDRLIYCPFNPGEYSFVKDRQIPIYLPKGRYETKGWMTNQEEQIIACGFSDFSL